MQNQERHIKLTVEYDGTDFAGWQIQPDQRTVQGEIEKSLKKLTGKFIRIYGAGRTDAGVHALGQVLSFPENAGLPIRAYEYGLNRLLPDDIRVKAVENCIDYFDARRHATQRSYRYIIAKKPRVIGRQYAWHPRLPYDLEPMKEASRFLLGEHDFTAFCRKNEEGDPCDSKVFSINWTENAQEIWFDITAIRYFHNMIRIIMGTLMNVGRGQISIDDFKTILDSKDRTRAGKTAPPHGLFLVEVSYDKRGLER